MSFRIRTSITDTAVAAPGMNPEATVAAGDSTCFYKTTRTGTDDDEGIRRKIVHTGWYWVLGCNNRHYARRSFVTLQQSSQRRTHREKERSLSTTDGAAAFKTLDYDGGRRRHQLLAIPTSNCASNGLFGGGQKSRSPPPLEKSNRFSLRPMPD